jgi:hypothetical protein
MAKTERSTVTFIEKENMLEVHPYEGIPSFKSGNLYLQLKKGTTIEQAQQIVRHLKEHVTHLVFVS